MCKYLYGLYAIRRKESQVILEEAIAFLFSAAFILKVTLHILYFAFLQY